MLGKGLVHSRRSLCIMGMGYALWERPVHYGNDLCIMGMACVLGEGPVCCGRSLCIHPFLASVETEFKDKFHHSVTAL